MSRLAALLERLTAAARGFAVAVAEPPARDRRRGAPVRAGDSRPARRRVRRPPRELEQLAMDLGPARPRWTFSRPAAKSPHHARIVEHVEFARRFFPELDGITIRVGLALKRGVLGWGSLDPERPGIWVRPRRLHLFTIAHEMTHLLQARGLVPRGERQCDLYALARSPLLVDHAPSYLKLPRALRRPVLTTAQANLLTECARQALAAREAGDRQYLKRFEREIDEAARG